MKDWVQLRTISSFHLSSRSFKEELTFHRFDEMVEDVATDADKGDEEGREECDDEFIKLPNRTCSYSESGWRRLSTSGKNDERGKSNAPSAKVRPKR